MPRVSSAARRPGSLSRLATCFIGLFVVVSITAVATAHGRPVAGSSSNVPAASADAYGPSLSDVAAVIAAATTSEPPVTLDAPATPTSATSLTSAGDSLAAVVVASTIPTAEDRAAPTLGAVNITPLVGATMVTPNPTAVPAMTIEQAVVNILLVGSDYRPSDATFRTDTLIVASINTEAGSVSMLSIPRDLFVYIPKWGMGRINQAYGAAAHNGYPGGGPALLEQTILYNLGIPIHYYALVSFDGFRAIVDTLGGIDVPVNCQLTEYKLKEPALDERDAANYDLYTQPIGVVHMDGALALWYARARPVGGDFFRGYRQRQVLRAIYHKGMGATVLPQIPALYADISHVAETDMSLWDVMQFVPLAAGMDDTRIRSLNIGPNQTTGWITPNGEAVLLPRPGAIETLVADFLANPSVNRLSRPLTWVEVANAAPGLVRPELAAETLINDGFAVKYAAAPADVSASTTLIDFTTSPKGSPVRRLQALLHVTDDNVIKQPDSTSPVEFRLIMGTDYNACPRLDWMDMAP